MAEQDTTGFHLTLEGFTPHPLNCPFLVGYGTGVGQHWEVGYGVIHDLCVRRSDDRCSFVSRW